MLVVSMLAFQAKWVGSSPIHDSTFHQQDGAQQNYLFQTQFYGNWVFEGCPK